jgi:hypothetical protein
MKTSRYRVISSAEYANRHLRSGLAAGPDRVDGDARPTPSARAVYRLLASTDLEPAEAGNLTAFLTSLGPVEGGWMIGEIERLLFVRYLVAHRRLRP